jgi:hypothetical protein
VRCWVLGAGCRVQGAGCRVLGARCWVQGAGFEIQGFAFDPSWPGLNAFGYIHDGRMPQWRPTGAVLCREMNPRLGLKT